jgi:predicted secreted acid phosphatase
MSSLIERIQKSVDQAIEILDEIKMPKNPAMIFDIDDTLIDMNGIAIDPVVNFYNHVKILCITPIIVTNRTGEPISVEYTKYQLKENKITDYYDIYFRNPDEMDLTKAKLNARKIITEKGFDVVMSIGDQKWDIGEYGGVGILIPSPQRYISMDFNLSLHQI